MKNILLSLAALSLLAACAQGVTDAENSVERLATCVIDGNQNNNCELSTLEGNPQK